MQRLADQGNVPPHHYRIKITRRSPHSVTMTDAGNGVVCALNGRVYTLPLNQPVVAPAEVVNILEDAGHQVVDL